MALFDFTTRPWAVKSAWFIGLVGTILTAIGTFLAFQARASRDLRMYVVPSATQIVQAGQTSNLSVSFNGKPIDTDIVAVQVVVWNHGRQNIKRENVLAPIVLKVAAQTPILEAKVIRRTRGIIGESLTVNELASGKVGINFDILEESDGFTVQLILSGSRVTQFDFEGVVEGHGGPEWKFELSSRWVRYGLYALVVPFVITPLVLVLGSMKWWVENPRLKWFRIVFYCVSLVLLCGAFVLFSLRLVPTAEPPATLIN